MHGGKSEAFFTAAIDGDIVKKDTLQFLDGPVGEQEPGEEGVEEEEKSVGDAGEDAVLAGAAGGAWTVSAYRRPDLLIIMDDLQTAEHVAAPQHEAAKERTCDRTS